MVVFTCNHCGESLKKNTVEKHIFRCRRDISVGCMDCLKDFNGEDFSSHIQCVSELERYSAKGFVHKPNQNKGQRKQEAWVDLVRSITEKKTNLSSGVKKILETISSYDNIPRKKAKFLNFMRNSFRYMKLNELEDAWVLLEEAMRENKPVAATAKDTEKTTNGTSEHPNGKRKLGDENGSQDNEQTPLEPVKKKRKVAAQEEEVDEESARFSWSDTIRNILSTKNNELQLKKLRKKVLKRYQTLTGGEMSDKVENKFNKKINKIKGIVVDNEKVRLIE